ncbi:hypothetical protein HHI36_009984 [Cryptolaemus montrouzieri]|uniref:Uncharacterized protein n=1 Tax=Cryptolaemus montrouzieri TaxID=559131 RepID=A0ABD2MHB7_9CUCU
MEDGLSKAQILDYFANLSSLVIYDKLAPNVDLKTYGRIIQNLELSGYNTEKVMEEYRRFIVYSIHSSILCKSKFAPSSTYRNNASTGVGQKFGLQFDIDVVEEEYISAIKPYYGLDVTLHQPNVYPETKYLGTPVAMGSDVQFTVIPEVVFSTEELRSMDIQTRQCLFEEENPLKWKYTYSFSGCKRECEAANMKNQCNCVPYYYPIKENIRICTLLDLECLIGKFNCIKYLTGPAEVLRAKY